MSPAILFIRFSPCKIMSNRRRLRGKDLANQDIDDIFEEFYQLQLIIDGKSEPGRVNYSIARLVTVLEQFFRFVVECGLEKDPDKTPPTIEMDPHMIDSVSRRLADISEDHIRNYVVSLSYSFQNQHEIVSMMEKFEMLNKQNNIRKTINGLDGLFQLRHKVVHTVERQNVSLGWIKKYHTGIESLMHEILDELRPLEVSFYCQKMKALKKFELRENRKKNFETGNRYHKEAIACGHQAIEYLKERIKNDAHDIDAHSQLMDLYIDFGDRQNVDRCCEAILGIDSDHPVANYYMGSVLKTKNPMKAMEYFTRAIEGEPDVPAPYIELIAILTSQKRYVECLSCIDEAIENMPLEPVFHMKKGAAFGFLNMPEYAEMYYENADRHAIDYVKTFTEDVGGCVALLNELQDFGRDDAITECRRIMDEYWKKQT